jgi:hypothetical protein
MPPSIAGHSLQQEVALSILRRARPHIRRRRRRRSWGIAQADRLYLVRVRNSSRVEMTPRSSAVPYAARDDAAREMARPTTSLRTTTDVSD